MLSFPIVELFLFALYQPDRGLVPDRWTADKGPPMICYAVKIFRSKLFYSYLALFDGARCLFLFVSLRDDLLQGLDSVRKAN